MQMFDETEIPITQVLPTHVGRSMEVMKLGFQFAKKGGYIDFTTSRNSAKPDDDTRASHALRLALEEGVDSTHVTFSSDGQGSLPRFDSKGNNIGLDVGSCQSLYGDVKDAVLTQGVKFGKRADGHHLQSSRCSEARPEGTYRRRQGRGRCAARQREP